MNRLRILPLAVIVVALLLATALCCVACNDNSEDIKKPKPVDDYIAELADSVVAAIKDGVYDGDAGLLFSGQLVEGERVFDLSLGINYDIDAPDESAFVFSLKEEDEPLIAVAMDGSDLYSDISLAASPWLNGKVMYENMEIFPSVDSVFGGGGYEYFENVLASLGKAVFSGVDVNEDKSVYTFALAPDAISAMIGTASALLEDSGNAGIGAVAALLGGDIELPQANGNIEFYITDGVLTRIIGRNVAIGSRTISFGIGLQTGREIAEQVVDEIPSGDPTFRVSKLANAHAAEEVTLRSTSGAVAKYDYQLDVNLDVFALALAGYDFAALSDDNFFHFKMEHVCSDQCGSYCAAKTREGRGAIFEVAFSPTAFGTHNIYINLDVRYLLAEDFVEDYGSFIPTSLSDYVMIVMSPGQLSGKSDIAMMIYALCGMTGSESVTLSVSRFLTSLGVEEEYVDKFTEAFFTGGYSRVSDLVFDVQQGDKSQSYEYDIYKQFVWIIDDEVSEVKDYQELMGLFGGTEAAMSWTFEPLAETDDGVALTNIYNGGGSQVHGSADGAYVPMSATEAAAVDELFLKMDYTDIDGETHVGELARIFEIRGLDPQSSEPQQVTFAVQYPNVFMDSLFGSLFPELADALYCTVQGVIRLTPETEDGFAIEWGGRDGTYTLVTDSRTRPSFLEATMTLSYQGGLTKSVEVEGTSSSVIKKQALLSPHTYSIVDWGLIAVDFEAAGRSARFYPLISMPTRVEFSIDEESLTQVEIGSSFYFVSLTNCVHMYAYYGSTRVDVDLMPDDFTINGASMATATSEWTIEAMSSSSFVLTFLRANNYELRISKGGYVSDPFLLSVLPASEMEVRYGFEEIEMPSSVTVGTAVTVSTGVINLRHGVSQGEEYTLTASVRKVAGSQDVTQDVLTSMRIDGANVQVPTASISLPEMLKNPVPVSINLTFDAAGEYELRFELRREGDWQVSTSTTRITVQ